MTPSSSLSLTRILVAPWQQRLSLGGRWSFFLVVAMCLSIPVLLLVMSLFFEPASQVAMLRVAAFRTTWICLFALLVLGWAMLVGNVLQQNHPTLARLVPHHPGQLRTALLVAWAMVSLAAAAMSGFAFQEPLAWACGAAGALALLAAALRWPLLCLGGIGAPFLVNELTRRFDASGLGEAIWSGWVAHEFLWTAVVATAGALILVVVIGNGGARHRAAYEARTSLRDRLQRAAQGQPAAPTCSSVGWLVEATTHRRLYGWWMRRLLARRDSPVMSRLLAGLGPATHWTSRVLESLWFLVIGGGTCLVTGLFMGDALRSAILPWVAYSVLAGACTNALQAVPRLRQTQREQALLVLLPGVPRGARLNRWLGWQMSGVFLVAGGCGLALAGALNAFADARDPGVVSRVTGGMTAGIAAALLPQVVWQWRRWARMRGASTGNQTLPVLVAVMSGLAILALHAITGVGYTAVGVTLAIAALLHCAWRWWRMGSEPSALPVGRLG